MSAIIFDVLPIFLLILIGWLIVRVGILTASVGDALSEFVFKIAVPLLLFRTIAEADFHGASPFRLWLVYFSGVAVTCRGDDHPCAPPLLTVSTRPNRA